MNSKMLRVVVLLGISGAAWLFGNPESDAGNGDPVVNFAAHDQDMNAAQATAKSHLPDFFKAALTPSGSSKPDTLVKVAFPIDDPQSPDIGFEVIWVGQFQMAEKGFIGRLANEPVSMPGFEAGSPVEFTEEMVRDWILPNGDGRFYGHYTTRVIAAQSDNAQFQDMIAQILMPEPVPADWK